MHFFLKAFPAIETDEIVIYLVALCISLIVFFLVIKSAVKAGTKDLVRSNRLLVNLKAEEMKANGQEEVVQAAIRRTDEFELLLADRGRINDADFSKRKEQFVA